MGKHTLGSELRATFPVYQPLWVTNCKTELNTGLLQGFTVRSEITRKVLGTLPGSQQAPHNSWLLSSHTGYNGLLHSVVEFNPHEDCEPCSTASSVWHGSC